MASSEAPQILFQKIKFFAAMTKVDWLATGDVPITGRKICNFFQPMGSKALLS
jgi:hypothetical protein